ncbi:MAG: ureidoglycolate lyase [Deltaproteobacteria bacterium]|nr:ureidoglycolate lyase [Deltaproteobacteria bacterium]
MSTIRTLLAQPISREAFAPFGELVSAGVVAGASANQGTATRFDHAARLESDRVQSRPNLAVFRAQPQDLPFVVKLLEHHPHSSQAFIPMVCKRFLVIVAPTAADGGPSTGQLAAFVCGPGQGVNYHAGVWHHPIVAIDGPADFAMLAWEDGTAGDCVERQVQMPVLVRVG